MSIRGNPRKQPEKTTAPTTKAPKAAPAAVKKRPDLATSFARGSVTLKTVLGVSSAHLTVVKERAHKLILAKKMKTATPLLEGLVALDPYDCWSLVALARAKMEQKDTGMAKKLVKRALDVRPDDETALELEMQLRSANLIVAQLVARRA